MSAKARRGVTSARSIAVANVANTTSDRRRDSVRPRGETGGDSARV